MNNSKILPNETKVKVRGQMAIIKDSDKETLSENLSDLNYYIKYDNGQAPKETVWYDESISAPMIESVECSCCGHFIPLTHSRNVTTLDFPEGRAVCLGCHSSFEDVCSGCGAFVSFDGCGDGDAYNICTECGDHFCDDCVEWDEYDENPICVNCK